MKIIIHCCQTCKQKKVHQANKLSRKSERKTHKWQIITICSSWFLLKCECVSGVCCGRNHINLHIWCLRWHNVVCNIRRFVWSLFREKKVHRFAFVDSNSSLISNFLFAHLVVFFNFVRQKDSFFIHFWNGIS